MFLHSQARAMATESTLDSRLFSTKKINILLDDSNYLLWRQQVLLVVKTYKLQHFLDPKPSIPLAMVTADNGEV